MTDQDPELQARIEELEAEKRDLAEALQHARDATTHAIKTLSEAFGKATTATQKRNTELEATIQRVRDLHKSVAMKDLWTGGLCYDNPCHTCLETDGAPTLAVCKTCHEAYPCPTIQALEGDQA